MPRGVQDGPIRDQEYWKSRPAPLRPLGRLTSKQELAARIRRLIGSDPDLTERKMFGGLAFRNRGNMAIAASGESGAMVRVDPQQSDGPAAVSNVASAAIPAAALAG